jgi:hypothetical protein
LVRRLLPLLWRLVPLLRELAELCLRELADVCLRELAELCLLPLLDRLLLVFEVDCAAEVERRRLLARFDVPRWLATDISPSCFRLTLLGPVSRR